MDLVCRTHTYNYSSLSLGSPHKYQKIFLRMMSVSEDEFWERKLHIEQIDIFHSTLDIISD
jgi:hypothetical protein